MDKLVLTRRSPKTKIADRNSILMRVRMSDYEKISELSLETGVPMIQLISLLIKFATENLELVEE